MHASRSTKGTSAKHSTARPGRETGTRGTMSRDRKLSFLTKDPLSFFLFLSRPVDDVTTGVLYFGVVTLAVGCYANCLRGDFVHDDVMAIVKNPNVRAESSFGDLWSRDFWGQRMSSDVSHKSYRPLTVLTFRLNYLVGGLNPFGYHLVNVLLHALAAALFMYLCRHVVGFERKSSAVAGAMFAVHPIHTEAVSGIVGRADVLSCIFFFISIILYTRVNCNSLEKTKKKRFLLLFASLVSALCAGLSKETGYSTFIVCLGFELWHSFSIERGRPTHVAPEALIRIAATISTLSVMLILRGFLMNWSLPLFTEDDNPASFHKDWSVRLMTYLHITFVCVWLTVNPSLLSYDWSMGSVPLVTTIDDLRFVTTVLFLFGVTVNVLLITRRKTVNRKPFVVGYFVMIASFLPTTNLIYRVGFVIAERLLYIPSAGFIILFVAALKQIYDRLPKCRYVIVACVIVLMTSHAARTLIRNRVWNNRNDLFRSGVQSGISNGKFYYNYGNILRERGNVTAAINFYREAIRLWPSYVCAKNNLGTIVSDAKEAENLYREVLTKQPGHANARFNLGNLLSRQGDHMKAVLELWKAVSLDPESPLPHSSLAAIYRTLRMSDLADWHYLKAIELGRPVMPNAYYNYAAFLREQGRHTLAVHYCSLLVQVLHQRKQSEDFGGSEALEFNSFELFSNGQFDQRVCENYGKLNGKETDVTDKQQGTADEVTTGNFENDVMTTTARQWSERFGSTGQHKQAIGFLEDYLATNGLMDRQSLGVVHYELARHLQDSNREEEAFKNYQKAVEFNPMLSDANHRVAIFYHLKGETQKAEAFYLAAQKLEPNNKLMAENLSKLKRPPESLRTKQQTSSSSRSTISAKEHKKKFPATDSSHRQNIKRLRFTNCSNFKINKLTENNGSRGPMSDWGHRSIHTTTGPKSISETTFI